MYRPVNFHKANAKVCQQPGPENKCIVTTQVQELFLNLPLSARLLFSLSIPFPFFSLCPSPHVGSYGQEPARSQVLMAGWVRSPGGGHGNPSPVLLPWKAMDRGAWWATVRGVGKSRTRLSDWHFLCCFCCFLSHPCLCPFCRPAHLFMRESPPSATGRMDARDY